MQNQPDFKHLTCFVIVVTYNGSKWIDKCFGSLLNSTISIKVIAVDNGSTDSTPELLRKKFPEIEIVELEKNLGFGGANNIGIKMAYKAGTDYLFLLNQDAWVETNTIEKLIETAKTSPEYGIISPVHLDGEGSAFDYGFVNYLSQNKDKKHISDFYLKSKNELLNIYPLDFVNAAAWLLPLKTIEIVGGFNPAFFHYGEDQDYINRCHYFNLKVGFLPSAKAYHNRPQYDSETKKKIVLRTSTLAQILDPHSNNRFNENIKSLLVSICKDFLRFRFSHLQYLLGELKYYYSNKKKILEIANKVKIKGLNFLE